MPEITYGDNVVEVLGGPDAVAADAHADRAEAAASTATVKAAEASASASAADASEAAAAASQASAAGSAADAEAARAAAVLAQELAEAAASAPGIEISGGVGYLNRPLSFGGTTDLLYEMNTPGQPGLIPAKFQFVDNEGFPSLVEHFRFYNDTKALNVQFGKNRGDGIPGSATFGRKHLAGQPIVQFGFYAGKDSDGTTTAFCHAGYLSITAEEDQNGSNEISSWLHLRPGSTMAKAGAGNGIEVNSKAQAALSGPNQGQYGPMVDHSAIWRLGPGSENEVPQRFTPAPLKTTPVEGGFQIDSNGKWWLTIGLTAGGLSDQQIVTAKPVTFGTLPTAGGAFSSSLRQGPDWAELTLVIGGSDVTVPTTINLPISPALSASPMVAGSYYCLDGSQPALNLQFRANATSVKITVTGNPLKAGQTYVFALVLKHP